jgi:hypothetical protein
MRTLRAMIELIGIAIAMRIAMGILFYDPQEKEEK